ncbi:MAG: hypothetical protein ACE5HT_10995 [Gemmatimonadales bacterium]
MLSSPRRRPHPLRQQSLRQDYEEFVLQRIEEYKEQLSREKLLALADEAVRELDVASEEQLVLTEVLVLEHVDRLITRRLNLPSFRRWRNQHGKKRQAQRDPGYWGLEPDSLLVDLALRLDEGDVAVLVGTGTARGGFLLAAHDWPVLFLDQNIKAVERVEARAAEEGLARRFSALVVAFGAWFPDAVPTLGIIDPSVVAGLDAQVRERFISTFKDQTRSGGIHVVLPAQRRDGMITLSTESLRTSYSDWSVQHRTMGDSAPYLIAVKP